MRIVSQDGKIDMPYEMVGIFRFKTDIYFLNKNLTGVVPLDDDVRLAAYSAEEKAIKAMEMLRETYIGMPIVMQNVAISEDLAKEFERLKKYGVMVRAENQPSKVECVSNAVFQFPQDNEIEV
nr:MAG TPA: hypothetical protein [Caudoviricetes sp.]